MSNWTHVAGIIRVDDISFMGPSPDFEKILGKECLGEDPNEVWYDAEEHPEKYLPMGSEGSLRKTIWTHPNPSMAARYTITVFGDLRDHDDPNEIVEWFKKACDQLWVRNAVITVRNEWNGTVTWTADTD